MIHLSIFLFLIQLIRVTTNYHFYQNKIILLSIFLTFIFFNLFNPILTILHYLLIHNFHCNIIYYYIIFIINYFSIYYFNHLHNPLLSNYSTHPHSDLITLLFYGLLSYVFLNCINKNIVFNKSHKKTFL
jgi:hypothetical protein